MIQKLYLLLFVLLMSVTSKAQSFTSGGILYNVTSTSPATVEVGNNGANSLLPFVGSIANIPSTVTKNSDIYAVTSIARNAFASCTGLTSVTIPNSVTNIGQTAFSNCLSLNSVTVNWASPLLINANVFEFVSISSATLKVPAGTKALYQAATTWSGFGSIVEPATHLNFDGVDDYVALNHFQRPNQVSAEAWIKTSSNAQNTILGWGNDNQTFTSEFKIVGGQLAYAEFDQTTSVYQAITSNILINDNNWHHVSFTRTNGAINNVSLYIDGVINSVGTVSIITNTNQLSIGAFNFGGNQQFFNGSIDDVRIWNVARTGAQISANKNCELQGNESGLVAYYKFNQGLDAANNTAITTATATTGSGGTLSGFTLTGATSNFLSGSPVTTGSTIPTAPTASAQSYCSATTANSLVPAISATIKWYASQTTTTALATTDNLTTGTYYVVAVNANGCESDRTEILVNVGISSVTSQTNVSCNGGSNGSATVNPSGGTGGYTYSWSPSGGTAATATGLSAGTYTVTVTDANGCTTTANFVITEPTSIAFSTLSLPNRDYNQSYSQTVVATGGVGIISYSLTSGSLPTGFTLSNPGVISGTSTDIGTFTFIVIATDANGCSISQNLSIGLNQIPVAVTAIAASKVYGTSDPVLTYSVSPSLSAGDSFTGSLTRTAGENVGNYAISQGTLSAGSGYLITFVGANFDIVKADQVIVWNQNLEVGCNNETTIILTASASSGLPVTYNSSNSNIATVAGDILTIINNGTAGITASQSGDSNYNPATNVINTLLVKNPGLIRQHWKDVLFFDNSSNEYVSYQWYKNGTLINGATNQYYKENGDLDGDYYAEAINTSGNTIVTCPLTIIPQMEIRAIKVFPNPSASGETVNVQMNLPAAELQGAKLYLYNMIGSVLNTINVTGASMDIQVPNAQGIYPLKLQLANGDILSVNIAVK